MSKTDRTRPSAVRVMEDPSYLEALHRCVEHGQHHGGTGKCDLPDRPVGRAWAPGARWYDTTCVWTTSHSFWLSADGACRCPHCMGEAYEMPRRIRERKQGKAIAHDAERENLRGDVDDLSDIEMPWETDKRWADEYGRYESDVLDFARLRDLLVDDGDLPSTSHVVDVDEAWTYECCEDCAPAFLSHWRVEVLHNDGRRETLRFDSNPWVLLAHATPAADMPAPTFEDSLR